MKKFVWSLLFCACVAGAGADSKRDKAFWEEVFKGVETKIVLHVVDEEGDSVPDVKCHFIFSRVEKYDVKDAVTDRDGNCVVDNLTCGNSIEINLSKEGHYDSSVKFCFIRIGNVYDVKDGKWQPYPIERTVTLRKIMKPVSLISRHGLFHISNLKTWTGFDILLNDWVSPYGSGEVADIEIYFDYEGDDPMSWRHQTFKIRFLDNPFNGAYLAPATVESEFPYLYSVAMNSRFDREFSDVNDRSWRKFGMLNGLKDMVFRIRSVTDEGGNLLSCYYGRIRRLDYGVERTGAGSLLMCCQYNPNVNDTDLEDDEVCQKHVMIGTGQARRCDEVK